MSAGLILISMTTQDKMAVSSKEDFGLKRLFRPALDSLSIQEQLPYYSARNLTQSRSSRLGSSRPTRTNPQPRKRIIDASLYSPKDKGEARTRHVGNLDWGDASCGIPVLLHLHTSRFPLQSSHTYISASNLHEG